MKLGKCLLKWTSRKTGTSYALGEDRQIWMNVGFGWTLSGKQVNRLVSTHEYIEARKADPNCLIGVVGPSQRTIERWSDDGIAEALDGCRVEPDGTCPHGYDSWLKVRGIL